MPNQWTIINVHSLKRFGLWVKASKCQCILHWARVHVLVAFEIFRDLISWQVFSVAMGKIESSLAYSKVAVQEHQPISYSFVHRNFLKSRSSKIDFCTFSAKKFVAVQAIALVCSYTDIFSDNLCKRQYFRHGLFYICFTQLSSPPVFKNETIISIKECGLLTIYLPDKQPTKGWGLNYSIIKLMLRKNLQIASSAVLSQSENRSSTTSEFRRSKKKLPYKIQYCNQNLEEAIKEVKSTVRDNPEWKLNVKAVASQYPPSKERQSFANESQAIDAIQQQLPISNKLPFPKTIENTAFDTLKFTDRKRKEFEGKVQEIKERRMQLEVSLLEKQMRAKLQHKIQQNIKLKEKRQILRDIEQHREQSIRIREVEQTRKRMESSLLHQSNVASAKMIRKHRIKSHRQFLMDQKSKSDESALSLHFKQLQVNKEKLEHRQIILSRYKSLRCASQGTLRRKSIQTSQSTRKE